MHPTIREREGDPRIAPGLGPQRTRILETALGELDRGVREVPPGSNRGPEVDKYIPSWLLTRPGPSWCALFVCWVLRQSLGKIPTGGVRAGVHALRKDAQERGLWRAVDEYDPAPGDLFVQDMGRGTGHVGFVIGYGGGVIETLEGNSGDRVRAGLRKLDDPKLIGYICTVPKERYTMCWMPGIGDDVSGLGTR